MNIEIKKRFMDAWGKHFPDCDLPIVCFYTDELNNVEFPDAPNPNPMGYTCIFSQIVPVKKGRSLAFNKENLGCFGSFLPFGFDSELSDDVKGYVCNVERGKKSFEHLESMYKHRPAQAAPGKYLVFKRWDTLEEGDNPQVVFFINNQDVITGLHGLANFDAMTPYEVIAPFGTGCDSIVGFPMHELKQDQPKAVLGPLDVAVRKSFKPNMLTFAAPWPKFLRMLDNMDDSFVTTEIWSRLKSRLTKA